jgi:anti-sigma regulatory factor (Ser/Thr protein kinase)/Fe-S-cluster-containing hydrogenase component 2
MTPISYTIAGGDYEHGGTASRGLKEQLKRIGAAPEAIRRAMIAAYEAEMNVVIHARGGTLEARLVPGRLDVEVADSGPGIPDIEMAMKEGFSTAPAAARALGFGAGMGLPNIRRSSDVFAIDSVVGHGTTVRFTIYLKPQAAAAPSRHSVRIAADLCRACMACLRACPTRAVRVRAGRPQIIEHLCIDCGACIAACPTGALAAVAGAGELPPADGAVLVIPSAMLYQFGPGVGPDRVLAALRQLGYGDVRTTGPWDAALRQAVLDYARGSPALAPILSPACPAVMNLVAMRFPSLLAQVAPLESPMEAMREALGGRRAVFVAACPCQRTALESEAAKPEIVTPAVVRAAIAPLVGGSRVPLANIRVPLAACPPVPSDRRTGGQAASGTQTDATRVLRATGLSHVMRALEEAENGRVGDVAVLELYACDEGCFGAPAFGEDAFVARHRSAPDSEPLAPEARAIERRRPLAPRAGLRLDHDMAHAIEKLSRIQKLLRTLPGRDCGLCGSPTCAALAEDIVMGRAAADACTVRRATEEKSHESK